MTADRFDTHFSVPASHPALPGHFPGRPLVPGVVMLEQVALALRAWRGQRVARVAEVKFMAPLLPQQRADLHLSDANGRVRFEIRGGAGLLARGIVEGVTA